MSWFLVAVVPHRALLADRLPSFISILQETGFTVINQSHCLLTASQAELLLNNGVEDYLSMFYEGAPACALHLSTSTSKAYEMFDSLRPQLECVYGSTSEWIAQRDESNFFPSPAYLERAIIAIKPKYSDALYEYVHATLDKHDFVVLGKVAKILSADEARSLCKDDQTTDQSIAYWTSDVSVFIAVERLDCFRLLQSLMGPFDPVIARECAPTSIRAQFGKSAIENSVFASASFDQAERDLAMLFPTPFPLEQTISIIRPEGVSKVQIFVDAIQKQGFTITAQSSLTPSRSRAELMYSKHRDLPYYEQLVSSLTSGPSIVFCLTKPAAIDHLNRMMGAPQYTKYASSEASFPINSLQSLLGGNSMLQPGIYASETSDTASRDVHEWFPTIADDSLLQPDRPVLPPGSVLHSVLVDGLTALCKAKPAKQDAVQWLADWLLQHNPNKPKISEPIAEKPKEKSAAKAVFCVDADDQTFTQLLKHGSGTAGYEWLDVRELIDHAAMHDKQNGPLITEYRALMRPIPSSVQVDLIERSINASSQNKFFISNFPANLELALEFESRIGKPVACIVNQSSSEKKRDDEQQAVIDHYQVFKQLRALRGDEQISTLLA